MPHFHYRAVTQSGELVAGEVEAPSYEEVIRRIEYLGHMPIEDLAYGLAFYLIAVMSASWSDCRVR